MPELVALPDGDGYGRGDDRHPGAGRYGYNKEADRITANFLSMILKEFMQHNTIVEKYDVERRESEVSEGLKFGYKSNEIGFGWTNAASTIRVVGVIERLQRKNC